MKNKRLHFLFAVLALVLASALEDVLPRILGVGVPVLLTTTLCITAKRPLAFAVIFAVAAGAAADAISSLPVMTSVSFYVLAVNLVRLVEAPRTVAATFGYALYQLWLGVWLADAAGNVFARMLAAVPVASTTMLLVAPLLRLAGRGAALDEEG